MLILSLCILAQFGTRAASLAADDVIHDHSSLRFGNPGIRHSAVRRECLGVIQKSYQTLLRPGLGERFECGRKIVARDRPGTTADQADEMGPCIEILSARRVAPGATACE